MNYHTKYLKYKCKYLELKNQLKGGVIGIIPTDKLLETKDIIDTPEQINNYVNLITIPDTKIIRVGSSINKIQPYFSDIDIMNIVSKNMTNDSLILWFIEELKKILSNVKNTPNTFFSDFKAGGEHWTVDEILVGKKNDLLLTYAIKIKDVVKLDIIGPYNERYLEMSTFFILESNEGYININDDYFSSFTKSLSKDIEEFKTTKPFKAIKRVWSLARIKKKIKVLDKLKDLIKSNIALLAQINADLETIELLLEHNSDYDINFIVRELNGFKEKISSILDIDLDHQKVDFMINNLILLFQNNPKLEKNKKEIINVLTILHDHLLKIINKETYDYMDYINLTF